MNRIVFTPINEWKQFFNKDDAWLTFTFILLEFENDYLFPGIEFTFMLLGLGFYFRINTEKYEKTNEN